ncbi:ISL3 family transposase [Aureibacillus halotolerans]|uniref:Transposase n=1 Tax=Aureibacillus halotolerans TaxID=1508390 RepID=A0A4R6U2E6_9BACI|nr:ISL3 family transposase [Aureibacillus halotolerans]TDQ39816.1 transposase [Aureibacillus halotolerans]
MQTQYINEMLTIPEVEICQVICVTDDEVHLKIKPVAYTQCCPSCHSGEEVIRKGSNGSRTVRHLSIFGKKTYLQVPSIRLYCVLCQVGFVWSYGFVGPKKRYTWLFENQVTEQSFGSTVAHSALMQQTPASTVQRMHCAAIPLESARLSEQAWHQAKESKGLVLGVDDFAIKKGHRYNTGIHDLKGGTMLDLLPGRTLRDLRDYDTQHPIFRQLNPKVVVMDLAPSYHKWISECFPNAIRTADRFHVHGYVIQALQTVRKSVQGELPPRAKTLLKANHQLLNPQWNLLQEESKKRLKQLLSLSPLLCSVWEWKEAFTAWYDESPDVLIATRRFKQWCEQGERIGHPAVTRALKTMHNWQEEIINYHRCRWTNATVEGRHNRIKAFQRRHYFTRNHDYYKAGILVECNRHQLSG